MKRRLNISKQKFKQENIKLLVSKRTDAKTKLNFTYSGENNRKYRILIDVFKTKTQNAEMPSRSFQNSKLQEKSLDLKFQNKNARSKRRFILCKSKKATHNP